MKVKDLIKKLQKYDQNLCVSYQDKTIGDCACEIVKVSKEKKWVDEDEYEVVIWTDMVGT